MDTMTVNKVVGGICGAALVFLLAKSGAESLYHPKGHGDEDHAMGFYIEVAEAQADAEEEEAVDFSELLASADISSGAKVFKKCKSCHQLADGQNGVGPHLYQIIDRDVAAVDGFSYSGALVEVAEVWDTDTLSAFLENPKSYAPGTAMSFGGLKKPQDRADLIAYLTDAAG